MKYDICNKDYCLTMQTYFILKKNGIVFGDWQDKFIFEILPGKFICCFNASNSVCLMPFSIKYLLNVIYPDAEKIILVIDNLNTHKSASLY